MTATITKKAGKGSGDRVISEMATFFTVIPGKAEELRAACEQFAATALKGDPKVIQKSGLRDTAACALQQRSAAAVGHDL